MKRLLSVILCLLVLCSSAFLFSSCKEKDDDNGVVDYTAPSSIDEETTTKYSVKGGSDPYVEDIWG